MAPPSYLSYKPKNTDAVTMKKSAEQKKNCCRSAELWPSHVVVWALFLKGYLAST